LPGKLVEIDFNFSGTLAASPTRGECAMNTGRTVFAQLMEFLPLPQFRRCVERYSGDYKVQHFSGLDQFLCLAFAQLTYRESLRDIEACLRAGFRRVEGEFEARNFPPARVWYCR
jgi:hypothetical protein